METNVNAEAIEGWQPSNCCIAGNRTGSTHELHLAHCQVHCPQDSPIKSLAQVIPDGAPVVH